MIAHVGDSRAVMGTISPNGSLSAIQLTIDMKANLPGKPSLFQENLLDLFMPAPCLMALFLLNFHL